MAILNQNHTMFAGETKLITVTCVNEATGALVDFSGGSITWVLIQGGTVVLSFGVGTGLAVTGTGVFTITLTNANTSGLSGTYVHQARTTLADGTVSTLMSGTIVVVPSLI